MLRARAEASDWLTDMHARVADRMAVQHAATELLANCAEHAYLGRHPETMSLSMELTAAGDVQMTVSDEGTWRSRASKEPSTSAGRGLAMARNLLDHLDVKTGPHGTTVTGTLRLERPAQLLTGTTHPERPAPHEAPFVIDEAPQRLVVRGPVLAPEAQVLTKAIGRLSRAGTHDLVVDLTEVTHLGSAAVQALHELLNSQGHRVVILAPNGTVAQQVLDLVQLPYQRSEADTYGPT